MKADEIARYLQDHPKFFEEYADLLAQLYIPHPHGGRAISITERQILTLREKAKQLESKLGELIRFGEENDVIGEKVHRLAVGLAARATSPPCGAPCSPISARTSPCRTSPSACGTCRRRPTPRSSPKWANRRASSPPA